jgi:hypothetical protein
MYFATVASIARTPASTVLHGCAARPIVDWPRSSCGSAPSLPSTQKADLGMATPPAPIQSESPSVPCDHCFRFDDHQRGSPAIPDPRELNLEYSIGDAQPEPVIPVASFAGVGADVGGPRSRPEVRRDSESLAGWSRGARKSSRTCRGQTVAMSSQIQLDQCERSF